MCDSIDGNYRYKINGLASVLALLLVIATAIITKNSTM